MAIELPDRVGLRHVQQHVEQSCPEAGSQAVVFRATDIVVASLLCTGAAFQVRAASRPGPTAEAPPTFPLRRAEPSGHLVWRFGEDGQEIVVEGRSYTPAKAIPVLVTTVTDPNRDADEREWAADRLKGLMWRREAKAYIPRLLKAYFQQTRRLDKSGILMCLEESDDQRILGFFEHLLRTERDPVVRLLAAYGLARWNLRSGVAELIRLLPSDVRAGRRSVGEQASVFLEQLNRDQGWGMPIEEIRSQVLERQEAGRDQAALARFCEEVLARWFEKNRARFPVLPAALREQWKQLAAFKPPASAPARPQEPTDKKTTKDASSFQPDPRLLEAIEAFPLIPTCPEWMEPVKRLKELAGPENRTLVLHLAYYLARDHSMPAYYKALGLLHNRLLDVMPDQVVETLAPLLDSDDDQLARAAETLLKTQIRCSDAWCVDDAIGSYLQRSMYEGRPLPQGLIRFVFRNYPGGALVTFARYAVWRELKKAKSPEAHQRIVQEYKRTTESKILWAEHVISDTIWKQLNGFLPWNKVEPEAARELEKLAKSKQWWARLYVAEIMRQYPAFWREALVRHLANDKHPLVREVINEIRRGPRPASP